jgi:hypothetical protein
LTTADDNLPLFEGFGSSTVHSYEAGSYAKVLFKVSLELTPSTNKIPLMKLAVNASRASRRFAP